MSTGKDQEVQSEDFSLQANVAESLHFRQEVGGRFIQIGQCCSIVDIHIDRQAFDQMKKGGQLVGRDSCSRSEVTFTWDDANMKSVIKQRLRIEVAGVFEEFYNKLWTGIIEDSFQHTREFVTRLYEEYKVHLLKIFTGSVVFDVAHFSKTSVKRMTQEKESLLSICRDFIRKCSNQNVRLTLTFEEVPCSEDSDVQVEQERTSAPVDHPSGMSDSMTQRMKALCEQQTQTKGKVDIIMQTLQQRPYVSLSLQMPSMQQVATVAPASFQTPVTTPFNTPVTETETKDGEKQIEREDVLATDVISMVQSVFHDQSDPYLGQIRKSVDKALKETNHSLARSEYITTMLCLDSSESMRGEAFDRMKRIAEAVVNGLEGVAEEHGLEENVGVVSMSNRGHVLQQPTNDYSCVRDAIDSLQPQGLSPVLEALVVALAVLQDESTDTSDCTGGIPRIIFITDGKVTEEQNINRNDTVSDRGKDQLTRFITVIDSSKLGVTVVWIPVGDVDKEYLTSLARLGSGEVVEEDDLPRLINYQRKHLQEDTESAVSKIPQQRTGSRATSDAPSLQGPSSITRDSGDLLQEDTQADGSMHSVWRWKDDGGAWHLYPDSEQQKLAKHYEKRPDGTCLVKKGNENFRVFFKNMSEKSMENSNVRHEVEIYSVDENELKSLRTAEKL